MSDKKRVVVIGSGPIRIGQGIEFDYCSVHSVWALREEGYEAIIINNNPETVSTDFDTSDALFFEPLTEEDVLNIIDQTQPEGVVVQFGGQTAINLAGPLHEAGVKILGTDSTASNWRRTAGSSTSCSPNWISCARAARRSLRSRKRAVVVAARSVSRCSSARASCSAGARWRSSTTSSNCAAT